MWVLDLVFYWQPGAGHLGTPFPSPISVKCIHFCFLVYFPFSKGILNPSGFLRVTSGVQVGLGMPWERDQIVPHRVTPLEKFYFCGFLLIIPLKKVPLPKSVWKHLDWNILKSIQRMLRSGVSEHCTVSVLGVTLRGRETLVPVQLWSHCAERWVKVCSLTVCSDAPCMWEASQLHS